MISGAVLLESNDPGPLSPRSLWRFFTTRSWRILLPLVIWTLFFAWYYHLFRGDPLSVSFSLRRILFDQPYEHLYFLWLLLELALLTPFLRFFLKGRSLRTVLMITLCFLGVALIWKPVRLLLPFFIPYVGYYLAGYLLKKSMLSRRWMWFFVELAVVCFAGIVIGTWLAFSGRIDLPHPLFLYEYPTLFVMGLSLSVFALAKYWSEQRLVSSWLQRHQASIALLSSLTFSMYLLHPVVIDVLRYGAGLSVVSERLTVLKVITQFLATVLLSGLLSYGIELVTARLRRLFARSPQPLYQ
jgi:surface polysaccharide O-acyltransferase-like enzyme